MRILQIHNFYKTPGGECSVVRAEKKLLETYGHDVFQFTADSREIDDYSLIRKGLFYLQIPYNLQIRRKLSRFIAENKPDIAHVHNVFPLQSPSVYSTLKKYKIPVVQTIHNFRFLCPNGKFFIQDMVCEDCQHQGFFSSVRKKCMHDSRSTSLLYATAISMAWKSGNLSRNIDRYIALNHFTAEKFIAAGVPPGKISICGNFCENISEAPALKKSYILYLGRLSSEKGIRTLLKAMQKTSNVTLKIAGVGPLLEKLKQYAKANPFLKLEFMGFVNGEEKNKLVREALATVIPSEYYENFPISVLESLALGTPVIASRIGGLPEIVEHGRTGLLFTAGNADELAAHIATLANNESKTNEIAAEALETSRIRFGPATHYVKLMEIYSDSINCPN